MANEELESVERWTAKRRVALIVSITNAWLDFGGALHGEAARGDVRRFWHAVRKAAKVEHVRLRALGHAAASERLRRVG
jgi:hypothetical protein